MRSKRDTVIGLILIAFIVFFVSYLGAYYHNNIKGSDVKHKKSLPDPPNVDYEILFDWKQNKWVPLRKEPQARPLDEEAIRRAKTIMFDSMQYEPDFDPLHENDPKME